MIKPLKPRLCSECKEPFTPMNSLTKVCGMACALDFAEKKTAKEKKKSNAAQKKKFLANDAPFQKAKAQKTFNEFIRLRDKDLCCISCDRTKYWDGQWHAGHYKTVGAHPELRFNEDNCAKQCSVCNNYLSGNLAAYRLELVRRIGIDKVEALESYSGEKAKLSAIDYMGIDGLYKLKIKALK